MIEKLIYFDTLTTNFIKNILPQNDFFDLFFSFFSIKGNSIIVWILVIILALFFEEKKHPGISKKDKKFIIAFTLSFFITTFIVEYPLKNIFQRQRPISNSFSNNSIKFQLFLTKCPASFSFPSGHAATAFALSTVLSLFDKKRRLFYYFIAFLIAYSRIYLGCHYFLDVLGGGILGIIIAKMMLKILI